MSRCKRGCEVPAGLDGLCADCRNQDERMAEFRTVLRGSVGEIQAKRVEEHFKQELGVSLAFGSCPVCGSEEPRTLGESCRQCLVNNLDIRAVPLDEQHPPAVKTLVDILGVLREILAVLKSDRDQSLHLLFSPRLRRRSSRAWGCVSVL